MTSRTVQHLLSEDWIAVVEEHLQAYPTAAALVVEPAVLGQYHAQVGAPSDPYHYTKPSDWDDYLVAYNDTVALWAEIVQGVIDDARDDAEWAAELAADREAAAEEREFIDDMYFSMRGA